MRTIQNYNSDFIIFPREDDFIFIGVIVMDTAPYYEQMLTNEYFACVDGSEVHIKGLLHEN